MTWFTKTLWFYFLSIWFTKCTFPYKNVAISSSSGEEISFFGERYCVYLSIMSIHCITENSFFQVPYLKFNFKKYLNLIARYRNHESTIRMNSKVINWSLMSIIMLNDLFRSYIMNCYMFWFRSSNNTLL